MEIIQAAHENEYKTETPSKFKTLEMPSLHLHHVSFTPHHFNNS